MGRVLVEYRGYVIRKSGSCLAITNKKGILVARLETLIVDNAKRAIDNIIKNRG